MTDSGGVSGAARGAAWRRWTWRGGVALFAALNAATVAGGLWRFRPVGWALAVFGGFAVLYAGLAVLALRGVTWPGAAAALVAVVSALVGGLSGGALGLGAAAFAAAIVVGEALRRVRPLRRVAWAAPAFLALFAALGVARVPVVAGEVMSGASQPAGRGGACSAKRGFRTLDGAPLQLADPGRIYVVWFRGPAGSSCGDLSGRLAALQREFAASGRVEPVVVSTAEDKFRPAAPGVRFAVDTRGNGAAERGPADSASVVLLDGKVRFRQRGCADDVEAFWRSSVQALLAAAPPSATRRRSRRPASPAGGRGGRRPAGAGRRRSLRRRGSSR